MRFAALAGIVAVMVVSFGPVPSASAADYLRHYHRGHHYRGGAYLADRACPAFEPADYRPKTINFHEPLCYAARPYGLSTHLYDVSPDLQGDDE